MHTANQMSNKQSEKTMIRVKCNPKFDRNETDIALGVHASKPCDDNSEYAEAMVDYHWITDSVYTLELLPISIYAIE